MGAFSGITKLLNEYTSKTKYASGDYLAIGGSTLNKILVSDLYKCDVYSGNLNTLFSPGCYYVNLANASGGPMSSGNAILEVLKATSSGHIQRVSIYGGDGITSVRQRIYTDGKWYAWTTLYTNFGTGSKKTYTYNSWNFEYTKISSNQVYFRADKTIQGGLESTETYHEIGGLPFSALIDQEFVGTINVGYSVVGSFRAIFRGNAMYCQNESYGNSNTRIVTGILTLA